MSLEIRCHIDCRWLRCGGA